MRSSIISVVSILACLATAAKIPVTPPGRMVPPVLESDPTVTDITDSPAPTNGGAYLNQWLEHNDHSKGTFTQRWWWNTEYYAGPGSPVVMFTPGEIAADNYGAFLTNSTIVGLFAQEIKGAIILIEHRYWGGSSPYQNLTAETLQYLTVDQAIQDFVYFAQTAELPFDEDGKSSAKNAPWVWSGGSYGGALAAWTESTAPGTFWAYHSSSAPVEAIDNYWQYYVPIQEGMPKNCSADISIVINYMDKIFTGSNEVQKKALATQFGLGGLSHY